jgi:hypothetical protein
MFFAPDGSQIHHAEPGFRDHLRVAISCLDDWLFPANWDFDGFGTLPLGATSLNSIMPFKTGLITEGFPSMDSLVPHGLKKKKK